MPDTYTITTPRGDQVDIQAPDQASAIAGAQKWDMEDHATSEANRLGVPPALALGVMRRESQGNPTALSPKGAMGPMQLMPDTAKDLGVDASDPYQNITGGVTYLKQQLDAFKDPRLALAAYNAGPGAVRQHGGVPPYPETQAYVKAILGDNQPPPQVAPQAAPVAAQAPAQPPPRAPPRPLPQRPNTAVDMLKSGASGAADSMAGLGDQIFRAVIPALDPINRGLQVAHAMAGAITGHAPSLPQVPTARGMIAPTLHAPQTVAGHYAQSVGEMAPAALAPGSIPARIANVVLPGLTSEGFAQAAQAMGANPLVQQIARTTGGLFGAGAASLRANPAALLAKPMTLDQVLAAKNAAYAKVDASGYAFPQSDVKGLAADIAATVAEKGGPSGARLYPAATAMADRIAALAEQPDGVPLTQLDSLRSDIYGALVKPGDREAPLGVMMRQKIDGLINGSDAPNIQEARDLNTRYSKMQAVTDKLDSAGLRSASTYSGGNYNNAVRQNLRPLIDPTSSQRIGNLTPGETSALTTAVKGTPVQNGTRYASKFLTNKFVQVPASLMTHGVATPVMEALGAILNKSGEAQTGSAVQKVLDIMAHGGRSVPKPAPLSITNSPYLGMAPLLGMIPALSASPALAQQRRATPQR